VYGDRQEILDDVDRALAGEEFSVVREINARAFETWYSPLRAKTGEVSGVIGVATDVTERKQAEEALREAEELFHSAFDNAPIGIAVSQPDGHYLRVNRALCEILGYSEEELRATTFQALTYPEDNEASMAYVDRLLAGEIDKYSLEKRYVRADGRPVWVSLSVSLVRAPDDRPLYYVAQVQDITERKRAEERLQEANRYLSELASLRADFTAMVAHEIGSPLAAIRGFLDVLATGELDPAERDGAQDPGRDRQVEHPRRRREERQRHRERGFRPHASPDARRGAAQGRHPIRRDASRESSGRRRDRDGRTGLGGPVPRRSGAPQPTV
jgi:PAS domain S-box-containing protein